MVNYMIQCVGLTFIVRTAWMYAEGADTNGGSSASSVQAPEKVAEPAVKPAASPAPARRRA